jgi:hypothetical protein
MAVLFIDYFFEHVIKEKYKHKTDSLLEKFEDTKGTEKDKRTNKDIHLTFIVQSEISLVKNLIYFY